MSDSPLFHAAYRSTASGIKMSRRCSLKLIGLGSMVLGAWPSRVLAGRSIAVRDFHVCLSPEAVLEDAEFPMLLVRSGISCVWLAGFFYGHWPWSVELLVKARERLVSAGLEVGVVNVPLGHPGDSLGSSNGAFPLTPPSHWRMAQGWGGKQYSGTSLHAPATRENVDALKSLRRAGFSEFFLDDDFRLARSPGEIGGCFCEVHREQFLELHGLAPTRWAELLEDVQGRRHSRLLREWVEFTCDELTRSFKDQRKAAGGDLGNMIMYLGAEKAGIRLRDYGDVPFRVGELMFDDTSFGRLKGKTDELFSVLFHRRFVSPEHAFSETTAYPADRLSAEHLAAKLVISTVADVRHTLFMSGVTPFPKSHWPILAPAMKQQQAFHKRLAGHQLKGPLKHYWGEGSRYAGTDQPFSLFLALGIPFEVTDRPTKEGWTFLSEADGQDVVDKKLNTRGTQFLCSSPGIKSDVVVHCDETLPALLQLKRQIIPVLGKVPYVQNDEPAVFAWYPSAKTALLWNPEPTQKHYNIRYGSAVREVTLGPLASALITDLSFQ